MRKIVVLKIAYKGFIAGTVLYRNREGKKKVFDLINYENKKGYTFSYDEIEKNNLLFEIKEID